MTYDLRSLVYVHAVFVNLAQGTEGLDIIIQSNRPKSFAACVKRCCFAHSTRDRRWMPMQGAFGCSKTVNVLNNLEVYSILR